MNTSSALTFTMAVEKKHGVKCHCCGKKAYWAAACDGDWAVVHSHRLPHSGLYRYSELPSCWWCLTKVTSIVNARNRHEYEFRALREANVLAAWENTGGNPPGALIKTAEDEYVAKCNRWFPGGVPSCPAFLKYGKWYVRQWSWC